MSDDIGRTLASLLEETLCARRPTRVSVEELTRRALELRKSVKNFFFSDSIDSLLDYLSEEIEWGSPDAQLQLRIDLRLIVADRQGPVSELRSLRTQLRDRVLAEKGRIAIEGERPSTITSLEISIRNDLQVQHYDDEYLDDLVYRSLRGQ